MVHFQFYMTTFVLKCNSSFCLSHPKYDKVCINVSISKILNKYHYHVIRHITHATPLNKYFDNLSCKMVENKIV